MSYVQNSAMTSTKNSRMFYGGIDPEWEKKQLQTFGEGFRAASSANVGQEDPYHAYLFGKLLEEDLHTSCQPMLPEGVQNLDKIVLKGICILQVVDIVNVGVKEENRLDPTNSAYRTLKLCLTDGHQVVYGIEFCPLPFLSPTTPRGAKLLIQDVIVRHGMLMLSFKNTALLGISGNSQLEIVIKEEKEIQQQLPQGKYSAAVMKKSIPLASSRTMEQVPSTSRPPISHPTQQQSYQQQRPYENQQYQQQQQQQQQSYPPPPPPPRQIHDRPVTSAPQATSIPVSSTTLSLAGSNIQREESRYLPRPSPEPQPSEQGTGVTGHSSHLNPISPQAPPVVLEISEEEEEEEAENAIQLCSSEKEENDDDDDEETDPEIQHLFYSPNTPRHCRTSNLKRKKLLNKRPRIMDEDEEEKEFEMMAMDKMPCSSSSSSYRSTVPLPHLSTYPEAPFQYFKVSSLSSCSALSALSSNKSTFQLKACIKSVVGFQFQTGTYELQVLIEDGSIPTRVQVDPAFVERLMGVSCDIFHEAMQKEPHKAHTWANQMQFALMTLQGIMTFSRYPQTNQIVLINCRPITRQDLLALLERVKYLIK